MLFLHQMNPRFSKGLVLLFCLATTPVWVSAQMNHPECISINQDKKDQYYKKKVKDAEKGGNTLLAAIHSCYWLLKAEKSKKIQQAAEAANRLIPAALDQTQQDIPVLTESGKVINGERAYQKRYALACIYDGLIELNDIYQDLPEDKKRSKKGPELSFEIGDYSPQYTVAVDSLESAKMQLSQLYLNYARTMPNTGSRNDALLTVKACMQALRLNKQNQEAQSLLQERKNPALGKVIVPPINLQYFAPKLSPTNVRTEFLRILGSSLNKREYFMLLPAATHAAEGNISIQITVNGGNFKREVGEPTVEKKSKEIGEEGSKKTVTATYTRHNKSTVASLEGAYAIRDEQTGQVLGTGQLKGETFYNYYWSTYTGNKEALSKKEKKRLQSEPAWPDQSDMYQSAMQKLCKNILTETNKYFDQAMQPEFIDQF